MCNTSDNQPKIKAVAEFYASNPDVYGNSSNFVAITNTVTGKVAKGFISGDISNIQSALFNLYNGWGEFKAIKINLPIRRFNQMNKGYEYIGCTPDEINKNILAQWNAEEI